MAAGELETTGRYHIARKQIPSIDGPVQVRCSFVLCVLLLSASHTHPLQHTIFLVMQGIKLESFIFDPLYKAQKVCLMEVERAGHFAPVKNANSATHETPDTARAATLALHQR